MNLKDGILSLAREKKTEYQYFNGVIRFRTEIGIDPLIEIIPIKHGKTTSSNPRRLYDQAKNKLDKADNFFEGDLFCLIVDRDPDSFTKEQYKELLQREQQKEMIFCVSNPCFEFWLLLHLPDCTEYEASELLENKKQNKNRNYIEKCLQEKLGGYNKSRIHFARIYKDKIKEAISRSKMFVTTSSDLENSLGTSVGILIQQMMKNEQEYIELLPKYIENVVEE